MYEEWKRLLTESVERREKAVTFHYIVLTNSIHLQDVHPLEFCTLVGVEPSWAVEFNKMMNLSKMLERNGLRISK